ncbi:MAG: PAS domain-containing sensor histidine kinase [Anaerolineae bacterium]
MRVRTARSIWLPIAIALGIIALDLIVDLWGGHQAPLSWPHLIYAALVVLIVFWSTRRAIEEHTRFELVEREARDALEARVRERTAELQQTNERLRAEIAERQRVELALQESRMNEKALLDASPGYAVLVDAEGVILAANELVGARWGLQPQELVGRQLFDTSRPDVVEIRRAALDQALLTGQLVRYEEVSARGTLDVSVSPVLDPQGRVSRVAAFGHDITHLRAAEQALAASEERYRTLFDSFPEPMTVWTRAGTLVMQNLVSARNLGGKREDYLGTKIHEVFGRAATGYLERIARVIDTGVAESREDAVEMNGVTRHFWTVMRRVDGWEEEGGAAQVISYEITERVRLEELAREAQAELAQRALERTAQEERQRLARELHDSVSQTFYSISLGANTALKLLDVDRAKVLEALTYVVNLARSGLTEMRALIFDLRPESLETEGLVAAIEHQVAAVSARQSIQIERSFCDEPEASIPAKDALYRIAQEALHNVAKHARCTSLKVRLSHGSDCIELEIVDDGVGFDPLAPYPGHLGLRSMRERAERAGGTLDIRSAPGEGARIRVTVPCCLGGEGANPR